MPTPPPQKKTPTPPESQYLWHFMMRFSNCSTISELKLVCTVFIASTIFHAILLIWAIMHSHTHQGWFHFILVSFNYLTLSILYNIFSLKSFSYLCITILHWAHSRFGSEIKMKAFNRSNETDTADKKTDQIVILEENQNQRLYTWVLKWCFMSFSTI